MEKISPLKYGQGNFIIFKKDNLKLEQAGNSNKRHAVFSEIAHWPSWGKIPKRLEVFAG